MVSWWRKKPKGESPRPRPWWARGVRLFVRGALAGLMWLLLVAALLSGGLLTSGALRKIVFEQGLAVAGKHLPGTVTVAQVEWPQLGHLRLTDLVWRSFAEAGSRPDTLAHVALLDLRLDMVALRSRDARIDSLHLVVPQLNGPAIGAVLAAYTADHPETAAVDTVTAGADPASFPRPGAIPGVPSVALNHWHVELGEAVLAADMSVSEVICTGALEAGAGHPAQAVVEHLELIFATTMIDSLTGHPWGISLRHLGLGMTLEARADSSGQRSLVVAVMDSLSLRFQAAGHPDITGAAPPEVWWQTTGPVRMENTAEVRHETGTYEGKFASDFVLPGALDLAPFLPDDFPHAHFDRIVGRLSVDATWARPQLAVSLEMDLEQTAWLDTGLLKARITTDVDEVLANGVKAATVNLDTLDFSLLGASVGAVGSLHTGELAGVLRAAVTDSLLALVFPTEVLTAGKVALALDAGVGGTLQQPTLSANLRGRLDTPFGRVPRLSLQVDASHSGGNLALVMADGVSVQGVELDSMTTYLSLNRAEDDSLTSTFAVAAWRDANRLALGGRAWADSLGLGRNRRVRLDSLVAIGFGQDVRLAEPFAITLGPGVRDIAVTPLVLAGEPGEISLGGWANAEGLDLASEVDLFLAEALLNQLIPTDFWSADGGKDLSLFARAELQGTRAEPTFEGQLQARLDPHRDEPGLGLDLDFSLAAGDSAGLMATMAIVGADSVILGGRLQVPGHLDPTTGEWSHTAGRPATISIPDQVLGLARINRVMPPEVSVAGAVTVGLEALVPLGAADHDTMLAAGGAGGSQVEGHISAPQLAIRMPNRSRLDLEVDLQISGALLEPTVGGRIIVDSGFFRIPKMPRSLHPFAAEPLLWELAAADTLSGVSDSLRVFVRPEHMGPTVEPRGVAVLPDLDLEIVIPGNLRIHGYGLDVELAGDLKVGRGFDEADQPQPKIQGEVHSVQGTLQFMNRVFKVERGEVTFVGSVPPDPVLDMVLEVDVSGTLVRIVVTGTASDPVVELNSEPDYEQQDIMAVLLFGQPLGELDNDERGGVQDEGDPRQELRQNLAGLAMAFGTAGLQNSVTNTFGVDMVEVGSGSAGDNTLMVGKFINPKLMLKYHHSLEKRGTYFLTMEYTLNRLFKLVTTYGQGEEDSGLELKWSRRY